MDDYKEYKKALDTNIIAVKKFLDSMLLTDLGDITYWDGSKAKVNLNMLGNKIYDILACTLIGALPKSESRGADGVLWISQDHEPEEIETKLCGMNRDEVAIGSRDGLYYSTNLTNPDSKAAIPSKLAGAFHAGMSDETLSTKARSTFLVVMDLTTNECVDAWQLDGATTLSQLKERKSKDNITLTLKLQVFMKYGSKFTTAIPSIGYDNWLKILFECAKNNRRYIMSPERIKKMCQSAIDKTNDMRYNTDIATEESQIDGKRSPSFMQRLQTLIS